MGSRAAPAPVDIGSGGGTPDYFSTGIHDAPAWPGEPLPEIPGGGMTEPASAPEPIESTTIPAPFGTGESVMSKVTQVIDNLVLPVNRVFASENAATFSSEPRLDSEIIDNWTRPALRIEDKPLNWL